METNKERLLPKEFVDAHHHFLDTSNNPFQSFLGSLVPNEIYLPQDYQRDVVEKLLRAGVKTIGSVHVECMPDDGFAEVKWVDSLPGSVRAIVGSVDLSQATADEDLTKLKQASSKLVGIRWILDCVGEFTGNTATHVATSRHDGIDYLRGSAGGYDGQAVPDFEKGFALLEKHNLSFDLQCAPVQLKQAAVLFSKYPNIRVCLDHLGKPRTLLGSDNDTNDNESPDKLELEVWRDGMKAIAANSNIYVKISMLGYAVPGWIKSESRTALMRDLVRETVALFGPNRCMAATNFWKNDALSDSDGLSDLGPDPVTLLKLLAGFLEDYSEEDRNRIFCGTAREFYKF